MPHPFNSDGSLRPFTSDEIALMRIETADVRDGTHPTLRLDPKGCSIDRAFWCDWTQRDNAIALFLGGAALAGSAPNYFLSRVEPAFFPDPGYSQYFAVSAEVVGARSPGRDALNGVPAYRKAKLKINYEQVFFSPAPDGAVPEQNRYVEVLPSMVDASRLSLPGSMMSFRLTPGNPPDGIPIPYGVGRIEAITKVGYKWHRVPYEAWLPGSPLFNRVHGDPLNGIAPFIGTVNKFPALGYPAGFSLFDGVEEEIVPDPVRGFLAWNLTFRFSIKNVQPGPFQPAGAGGGHNYLYWAPPGNGSSIFAGYYLATRLTSWVPNGSIPDGTSLFNERDHNQLWNVGI